MMDDRPDDERSDDDRIGGASRPDGPDTFDLGLSGGDAAASPNSIAARFATSADGGRGIARMLRAKLWENPCWLAFRLNYLALRYNTPLYSWISRTRGLSRVEYVVIYSLGLADGSQARDIAETSGFPRNTLSRAIARLETLGLIRREHLPSGGRNQPLRLSGDGWRLFQDTVPVFALFEQMMIETLSEKERETLGHLLAKVVMASEGWPGSLDDADPCKELQQVRGSRSAREVP